MSTSGLTLPTLTEAETLRKRIADLELRAEEIEEEAEDEGELETKLRMAFAADDLRDSAEKLRKRLNALEMGAGLVRLFGNVTESERK